MSETPPPRRPLATFLRATPAAPALIPTPLVPSPDLAAAPLAPMVPPPVAPLATSPRIGAAPVGTTTTARGNHGHAAIHATDPDQREQTISGTRHVPGDVAASTTRDADDNRAPVSDAADAPSAGATVGSLAEADQQTALELGSDPDGDDRPPASASPPVAETATAIHAGATVSNASPASALTTTQFQPLPAPPAPAFARRGRTRPRLRASGRQWALLIGLVGLLALQIVIADRAHLAADARWRPLVGAACGVLRCTLPAWREPAAMTLLNRDVRPLPANPGVLQIQASFRNDARWAQAWPWLQLSLSDADGRVIGTRVVAPQEYLGQRPAAQDTLAPGQAVQVAFRVREPAASTAAFSFDFR